MGTWNNNDGLFVKIGTTEAVPTTAGEYVDGIGTLRVAEFEFDLTPLTSTAVIQADNVSIPKNARIEAVEVVAEVAATSGGAPTLNVGLVQFDRTKYISEHAFVYFRSFAAIDANGEYNRLVINSTSVGTSVGTTLAASGLVTAKFGTAAYTAGHVVIRVQYYVPA